jgi:hypothetical protein
MELTPVESGNLEAVGYDPATRELQVQFLSGSLYSYAGVPQDLYDRILNSDSPGGVFAREVKNIYAYTRLS